MPLTRRIPITGSGEVFGSASARINDATEALAMKILGLIREDPLPVSHQLTSR
jgi:hypothetical protein